MRLLIYGFGPYKQFKDNITEKILRRLPARSGVKKVVFPVRFIKKQFIETLKKYKPEVVLGLGQSSGGKRLKIERRAVNRRRTKKTERPKSIVSGGPRWLKTSLKLSGGQQAKTSYNAGDYGCNYSMYVILDYLKRHRFPTRFGFIHIPWRYDPTRASRYLLKVLKEIKVLKHGL